MRAANLAVAIVLCAAIACDGRGPTDSSFVGVAALEVSPSAATMVVGGTARLTATPKDQDGNSLSGAHVAWASSDTSVAQVSDSGVVTARKAGKSKIKAKTGRTEDSALVVVSPTALATVVVTPEGGTINAIGYGLQLSATATDSSGATVPNTTFAWTSSNPATATVDVNGKVTAKAVGTVLIIAAAAGIADTVVTTVRQVPASLELTPASLALTVGASAQLRATVKDSGGTVAPGSPVTWVSSAPSVASVSASGVVTAVAEGRTVVTATSGQASDDAIVDVTPGTPVPPPPPSGGIWISREEIAALPMSGTAWNNVKAKADGTCTTPDLSNQDDPANTCTLAKALVFVRTGQAGYRAAVISAITSIVNSGTYSGRALALGRELAAYVVAADLIDLRNYDAALDEKFRAKLVELRTAYTHSGPDNLIVCHEVRPNNWGTVCGASRVAIAAYLNDEAELTRSAQVFKGWVGDRSSYAGFKFQTSSTQDARTWSPTPTELVPVNPKGATVMWNGARYNVDGALIDDISRGCPTFQWEPCHTDYPWEGLAGAIVQAEILHRRGYPAYEWQDQAVRRAYEYMAWLHNETGGYWFDEATIVGDDNWQPWIVNMRYGINLPTRSPTKPGKGMGWTDWTHAR